MRLSVGFLLAGALAASSAATEPNPHVLDRARAIDELNALPGMTWRAGLNARFHGQPRGVSSRLSGVVRHSPEELEALFQSGDLVRGPDAPPELIIPESFDGATAWPQCARVINDIRDQSDCGCCWAFGAASAASDR